MSACNPQTGPSSPSRTCSEPNDLSEDGQRRGSKEMRIGRKSGLGTHSPDTGEVEGQGLNSLRTCGRCYIEPREEKETFSFMSQRETAYMAHDE